MPELPSPHEIETLVWNRSYATTRINPYQITIEYERYTLEDQAWLRLPDHRDWPNPFVVGIDPGRNFGYALVGNGTIVIYTGQMPKQKLQEDYGILAFHLTTALFANRLPGLVGIEGASYEKYGEANLAHIRGGFLYACEALGIHHRTIPPKTSRKRVLGHGDRMMSEYIHGIADHGTDALCIALNLLDYYLPTEKDGSAT